MRLFYYGADWRSVAFVALAMVVYAVQWLDVVRHPLLLAAGMLLAFIGGVINHNHQHHPTFVPHWLNSLFGVAVSLVAGVPGTVIAAMHNQNHHIHNNDEHDHVRASIVSFRWRLLNGLLFPLVAIAHFAPAKAKALRAWKQSHPRLHQQLILERVVLYTMLVMLFVIKPWATLLYLGAPYLFGQWCILAINHLQHVGCDPSSRYNHSRNITSRWSNWWFFNNGFHTAHHLRPGLHWSKLPVYHAEIAPQMDADLNRRSLLWTMVELYLLPDTLARRASEGSAPTPPSLARRASVSSHEEARA